MKKFYFLICFFSLLGNIRSLNSADTLLIGQEIRYACEDATEVYFVWGINQWRKQDKNLWPEGTYEKGVLLSTPMKRVNGFFTIDFKVKPNTLIDYVFWITKGPKEVPSDIWDVNTPPFKDYHTLVLNDNVTILQSKLDVRPKQQLTILNYGSTMLLLGFIGLALIYWREKFVVGRELVRPSYQNMFLGGGLVLFLFLVVIRASVAKLSWDLYYHPFDTLLPALKVALYDHIYIFSIVLFFVAVNFLARKAPRIQKSLIISFLIVSLISLVAAILNIRVVEVIGKPFNYRWLYYSGFLNSTDSHAAIASNISGAYIVAIIITCAACLIIGTAFSYLLELVTTRLRLKKVGVTLFICINAGYMLMAGATHKSRDNYDLLVNPVTAFIESVNPFANAPEFFSMPVEDSLIFNPVREKNSIRNQEVNSKIKNVILVVLESTPAEYMTPYDKKFKVTPCMEKYLSDATVFENVYAHAPATNKSMVCLLASVYPWLSYTSITQEHPDIKIPSITSVLQEKGYRTAFFNSGDNRFQRADEFLTHRKFEEIKDCKTLNCNNKFDEKDHEWDPLDGADDECTANELMAWTVNKDKRPFLAMMWTYQTHYPYYTAGQEKNFNVDDPVFNRYLNAVNHSDMILGKLIEHLKENNLYESTLVVVVGDHGEAFGRHGQTTHASKIYEENLHIPFILINPAFKGEKHDGMGGSVDVAPTIMNVLGMQVPDSWEGNSLFTKKYADRTYFFCPWSDYLFGYREGDMKYIFNTSKNVNEVYNIKKDPYEAHDLYPVTDAQQMKVAQQKLAAWAQYQKKYMDDLIK
ncbi:MAG: sulfatase-like hydrolase/transferase [Bacteroidetes bacterium]|nr:sulfatase-like hydrolase/transferase [Bacteroidota bacterium]